VQDLVSETSGTGVVLCFTLARGAFATAVLRELCDW
jgi:tRNA(Glu) U13 pseudouridine synthase TruD